jgi:monofunctional biosynthetic peptidoglycan transglycosylase
MTWYRRWRRRRKLDRESRVSPKPRKWRRRFRIVVYLFLIALVVDLAYVRAIWPDWNRYKSGAIPESSFIQKYESRRVRKGWPPLRWTPVPFDKISENMRRAAIVGEDARFYEHHGIDFIALKDALEYNISDRRIAFGGSTISQQTAKNLFLSSARTPLRKWHELLLTLGMEHHLSKDRILDLYLNIAQFGRGIYGVEAAAQYYWGIPASDLDEQQAAELAATLPDPVHENPATRGRRFDHRVEKILYWMHPPAVDNPPGPGSQDASTPGQGDAGAGNASGNGTSAADGAL